jgi:YggT family protein
VSIAGTVLTAVLGVFLLLLIGRFVMDWVMVFARSYRPTGGMAVVLELVYSATDPPLKALRRVIPPLPLGRAGALDLSFMVLFAVVLILLSVVQQL